MDAYLADENLAFKHDVMVTLYRATSIARNNLPVVVKKHEFRLLGEPETQERITSCLNAALSQAKMQHPHTCDILEVQFKVEGSNCDVYHILESLETSVGKDIEEGKRYTEQELRQFLLHTSSSLAYAHNKVRVTQQIAHRDVKPDNVFRTGNTFKVGDFDCVFLKKESSYTKSYAGDPRYMSPQLRKACLNRSPYNAFKTDVFALGASFIHLATLTSPELLVTEEHLDEAVSQLVESLPYCELLKTLLKKMLAFNERRRPTMKEVHDTLALNVKSPQQHHASLQEKPPPAVRKNISEEAKSPLRSVLQPLPEFTNTCPACHLPLHGLRCSCGFVSLTIMSLTETPLVSEPKARDAREVKFVTCRQCGRSVTPIGETYCCSCGKSLNSDVFVKSIKIWNCPGCSYQNNKGSNCIRCKALKPTARKPNTQSSDFQQAARSESMLAWACLCCAEINLKTANACKKCHELRGTKTQPGWQCKCRFIIPMNQSSCPQCYQSNPKFKQSRIGRFSPSPSKEKVLEPPKHAKLNKSVSSRHNSLAAARGNIFELQRQDSYVKIDESVSDEQWICQKCNITNHKMLKFCLNCNFQNEHLQMRKNTSRQI